MPWLNARRSKWSTGPFRSLRQTIVGVVASIASDGALLEVRLVQSSGIPALDARTLEFVRGRYSWTPAQISGKPVRSEIRLVVRWFPERAR